MAFDGIVTKSIVTELNNIIGSKIDKIYEPDKNTIILGLYLSGKHFALNILVKDVEKITDKNGIVYEKIIKTEVAKKYTEKFEETYLENI